MLPEANSLPTKYPKFASAATRSPPTVLDTSDPISVTENPLPLTQIHNESDNFVNEPLRDLWTSLTTVKRSNLINFVDL